MEKFTGVIYVTLFLWFLSHVYYFGDVTKDLAPHEYNVFQDNLAISLGLIKFDIQADTVTNLTGGISKLDHSQLIRLSAPSSIVLMNEKRYS